MNGKQKISIILLGFIFFQYFFISLMFPISIVKAQEITEGDEQGEELINVAKEDIEGKMYLLSGDLIKNFKFDSFAGAVVSGNKVYGNKLILESEPTWKVPRDGVQTISSYKVGNKVYIYYKVAMLNTFNVITNVRIDQACETIYPANTKVLVGKYNHYGCLAGDPLESWNHGVQFNYWQFYESGNMKAFNTQNNLFAGNLMCSFDIAQSTLPNIFKDSYGNNLTKDFDHIAVSSIAITDTTSGKLTEDKPTIFTNVQETDQTEERFSQQVTQSVGDTGGFSNYYNPNIKIERISPAESWDLGIQFQTAGSGCNPTNKDGTPTFDPKDTGKSMNDCQFAIGVNRLSPVVFQYDGRFSYTYTELDITDDIWSWGCSKKFVSRWNTEDKSFIEPIALHVQNRYIQFDVKVVFNLWTQYELHQKPPDDPEDPYVDWEADELDLPEEYYDNLTWGATSEGFAGGQIVYPDRPSVWQNLLDDFEDLFGEGSLALIIMIAFIIIVALLGLWIFSKIAGARKVSKAVSKGFQPESYPQYYPQYYAPPPPQSPGQPFKVKYYYGTEQERVEGRKKEKRGRSEKKREIFED